MKKNKTGASSFCVIFSILFFFSIASADVVWDDDSQSYIERPNYSIEIPPVINPQSDDINLLWDDIHDTDGDDLYGNYSTCATMMAAMGINTVQVSTGTLSAAVLSGYDALVCIDEEAAYSPQEIVDVQNWIAAGGKLLMIGENGGAFNLTSNNQLIAPYNMQFYAPTGYSTGAANLAPHPTTAGITNVSWAAGSAQNISAPAFWVGRTSSSQDVLTSNESGITVYIINDSNTMQDSYINNDDNYAYMENVFEWLDFTFEPVNVEVTLTPVGTPIVIPATGGSFSFNIEVVNLEPVPATFDVWSMVTLPNGSTYGPIINLQNYTMGVGVTADRDRDQGVPANAPSGNYMYDAYVGSYPDVICDVDHFEFSKSAVDISGSGFNSWASWGESFDDGATELVWDEDDQAFIEPVTYDYAPPVKSPPLTDDINLLWDDIHDSGGDGLYENYSTCNTMMLAMGINPVEVSTGTLNATLLADYDALVLVDEEIAYSPQEIIDIQNWIASGGKLLVIGENSNAFNMASHNELLSPYGMQFNTSASSGANSFAPHAITTGVNSLTWAAGSAQDVSPPGEDIGWYNGLATISVLEAGVSILIINDSGMMTNDAINNADNYQCMQNTFEWLDFTFVPVDVTITLAPVGLPITIPAAGGSFDFNIAVTNNEAAPVTFDVWTMVTLPNGSEYGPIINVPNFTMAVGGTANRDRSQAVPSNAPSGNYMYDGYVGSYPNVICDEDHFAFSKSAVDNSGSIVNDWSNWGESFGDDGQEVLGLIPTSSLLMSAYPNPFNPQTSLSLVLPEFGLVNLTVFDVLGQEVTTLMDGYMPAGEYSLDFNAQNLTSGIYFARLSSAGQMKTVKLLFAK